MITLAGGILIMDVVGVSAIHNHYELCKIAQHFCRCLFYWFCIRTASVLAWFRVGSVSVMTRLAWFCPVIMITLSGGLVVLVVCCVFYSVSN